MDKSELEKEEKQAVVKKKNSGNIGVKIIAGILVAFMILPMCYTAVAYIIYYFGK